MNPNGDHLYPLSDPGNTRPVGTRPVTYLRRDISRPQDFAHTECKIELLELEKSGIHIASYLTKLLPKRALERHLRASLQRARLRLENQDAPALSRKPAQLTAK